MRPGGIKQFRDAQPFVPFRIVFTDGRTFEIPHPDRLFVARHTLEIVVVPNPVNGIPEETIHASPLHVVRIEILHPVA
ncbi:MAG TPA: hypothetical protein VMQ67_05995 [Candidatus Saccharimonadales bacterium]|jgi:hypothetical protein|nr:hypothetical protein [Candidatus Saccharimonadales bacterium]